MNQLWSSIQTFFSKHSLETANFLLVLATVGLACVTYALMRIAKMQFLGSMAAAFQDEWDEKEQWYMRLYLHSTVFKKTFDRAISTTYNTGINHTSVEALSKSSNLINPDRELSRDTFNFNLSSPVSPCTGITFTPFEALNRVMLCFDRILLLNDMRFFRRKFILKYKRPVQNLKKVLKPYIVIEQLLREKEGDFKKDLLQFLDS